MEVGVAHGVKMADRPTPAVDGEKSFCVKSVRGHPPITQRPRQICRNRRPENHLVN
jgi:hypothetical protein